MKRIYYFAYGSNLLQNRLEYRVGPVISVRRHVLEDYELVFNCGGFANIQRCAGEIVEGWLYELDPVQLGMLDRYEGLYYKEFFDLEDGILGVVYVGMPNALGTGRTSLDYFNIILTGMLEKELIDSFNKLVDQKEQMFVLKKGNKHKKREIQYQAAHHQGNRRARRFQRK